MFFSFLAILLTSNSFADPKNVLLRIIDMLYRKQPMRNNGLVTKYSKFWKGFLKEFDEP